MTELVMPMLKISLVIFMGGNLMDMDQCAVIMVVLGLPLMVIFALLGVKLFGRNAATDGANAGPVSAKAG
jgi:hypothetical protein